MARFVVSVAHKGDSDLLSNLPDIALVGPSNAGKSSLINALAKSRIALISNKPGKTRTLNFYDFNTHYVVDTPGYGYSHASKTDKSSLMKILDNYFLGPRSIVGVFQVVSSHGLSANDLEVSEYLSGHFHNYMLIVNKIDKISKNQLKKLLGSISASTGIGSDSIIPISAKMGLNLSLLNLKIREFLK
ncbi:probable GTP-binding protein EngB [Rattus rattus]|uniref:probable GTP-binding protein EngB n=1 Tax=Rattus rattus TaxID=10117 RepID=UPI0013F345E2|nr:probable GTP-binding protein EngB [Rattus rattus]